MSERADEHRAFVLDNTARLAPTLIPELLLHLADQSLPLWQKTLDEMEDIGLDPPYWAFAWAGGQALARFIFDNPNVVAGKKVVDLGAGSGLCAISAARCGARHVRALDIDLLARAAINLNAAINKAAVEIGAEDGLAEGAIADGTDVLLLGDLFYEARMAASVLALAERHRDAGCVVLAGDPGRSYFPRSQFGPLASYEVPVSRELEDVDIKLTTVWKLL